MPLRKILLTALVICAFSASAHAQQSDIIPSGIANCDLNLDGVCNSSDQALLQQWQQAEGTGSCDLNRDGQCDSKDEKIFNQISQQQQQQQNQGGLGGLGGLGGGQGGGAGQQITQLLTQLLPMLLGMGGGGGMGGMMQQAANAMGNPNFSPNTQGCLSCQPRIQKPTPSPTPSEEKPTGEQKGTVTVHSTEGCLYCTKLTNSLDQAGIKYNVVQGGSPTGSYPFTSVNVGGTVSVFEGFTAGNVSGISGLVK